MLQGDAQWLLRGDARRLLRGDAQRLLRGDAQRFLWGDAQWGYTDQYNRRGRNVTVVAQKLSGLRGEAPEAPHANPSFSTTTERVFQNHKKQKNHLLPLVILLRGAPSRSPRRALSGELPPSTHRPSAAHLATAVSPTLRLPRPPVLSRRGKQHHFRAKVHSFSSKTHHFSPLPHTRVTRHAPSHPHFSRGDFFAFTLHLHPYRFDIQMLTGEHYPHFLLHRGEGKGGAIFTRISLSSNDLRTKGEEVKAKIEKRRTRPRARKMPKKAAVWHFEFGSTREMLRPNTGR